MSALRIPAGRGASEVVEKRSSFLGLIEPAEDEEEARSIIAQVKKQHRDARHNCWCYRIRGGAVRYSDDAEPQGTAGLPMLEILQREGIENAVCVVTRYFGGVLLGTGGLLRAYQKAAKGAVEDAGISVVRAWTKMSIVCDYSDYEKIRSELEQQNAVISDTEYGEKVTLTVLVSQGQGTLVTEKLQDRTAGKCICTEEGIVNQAVPT